MPQYLDQLETRNPRQREADLMARLPQLIAQAQRSPGWGGILAGVHAADITTRTALAQLPVTYKSDLFALQLRNPPFGGLTTIPNGQLARIFMSPGPIFDPQGRHGDWWRFARPLTALGVRRGQILQNCFSYHFTPAAFMIEAAAAKLGCTVIPAGSGQTELQVRAMQQLRPEIYAGTPSFLKIIIEKAQQMGADISSVQRALVSAEALPASLRTWLQQNGVAHVLQVYGSADIGNIAYESETEGQVNPGMIVDEELIIEIVRPGTGEPVTAGQIGEILITCFNPDYPLIRFSTGDLSATLDGQSPCGRTNSRIKGWMGRADQATKVRAMFVHPTQIADITQRHPQILKARLIVSSASTRDDMILHCEVAEPSITDSVAAIIASIRDVTKLRGTVKLVARGSLPNDGKVIEDLRNHT